VLLEEVTQLDGEVERRVPRFAGDLRHGGVLRPTGERLAQGVNHAIEVVVVAGQRVRVLGIGPDALGELREDDVVLDVVVGPQSSL
jgi:hypothetical protein